MIILFKLLLLLSKNTQTTCIYYYLHKNYIISLIIQCKYNKAIKKNIILLNQSA